MSQSISPEGPSDPLFIIYQSTCEGIQRMIDRVDEEISKSISSQKGLEDEVMVLDRIEQNETLNVETQKTSIQQQDQRILDISGQIRDLMNTSSIPQKVMEIDRQIELKKREIDDFNQKIKIEDRAIQTMEIEISTFLVEFMPIEIAQKSALAEQFAANEEQISTSTFMNMVEKGLQTTVQRRIQSENIQKSTIQGISTVQMEVLSLTSTFNTQNSIFLDADVQFKSIESTQIAATQSSNLVSLKNQLDRANEQLLIDQRVQNSTLEISMTDPVTYRKALQDAQVKLQQSQTNATNARTQQESAFQNYEITILEKEKEAEKEADDLIAKQDQEAIQYTKLKDEAFSTFQGQTAIQNTSINVVKDTSGQIQEAQKRVQQFTPLQVESIAEVPYYEKLRDSENSAVMLWEETQNEEMKAVEVQDVIIQQEEPKVKKQVNLINTIQKALEETQREIKLAEEKQAQQQNEAFISDLSGAIEDRITTLQQKQVDQSAADLEQFEFKESTSNAGINYATAEMQTNDILADRISRVTDLIPWLKELDGYGNLGKLQREISGYELQIASTTDVSSVNLMRSTMMELQKTQNEAMQLKNEIETSQEEIEKVDQYMKRLKMRAFKQGELQKFYSSALPTVQRRVETQKQLLEIEQQLTLKEVKFEPLAIPTEVEVDTSLNVSLSELGIFDNTMISEDTTTETPDATDEAETPENTETVTNDVSQEGGSPTVQQEDTTKKIEVDEEVVRLTLSRSETFKILQGLVETETAYRNQIDIKQKDIESYETAMDRSDLNYLFTPSDLSAAISEVEEYYSEDTSFVTADLFNRTSIQSATANLTKIMEAKKTEASLTTSTP